MGMVNGHAEWSPFIQRRQTTKAVRGIFSGRGSQWNSNSWVSQFSTSRLPTGTDLLSFAGNQSYFPRLTVFCRVLPVNMLVHCSLIPSLRVLNLRFSYFSSSVQIFEWILVPTLNLFRVWWKFRHSVNVLRQCANICYLFVFEFANLYVI